jgi:hypothetical protein
VPFVFVLPASPLRLKKRIQHLLYPFFFKRPSKKLKIRNRFDSIIMILFFLPLNLFLISSFYKLLLLFCLFVDKQVQQSAKFFTVFTF